MSAVVVRELSKRFGATRAVDDVSFTVEDGRVLTLLGPSGCGKTTLLRCLAGLEAPDAGTIAIGGVAVFGAGGTRVPTERRNLGMVFQSYAIWPHLTVFDNVAFGLRVRRLGRADVAARVADALRLVRLDGLAARYPGELSGGQQQRVVLARCLAYRPALLLLDEPLANLDAQLREDMRGELRRIQRETRTTMVYVTHDQTEALSLSDEVLVMDRGRVAGRGAPVDVYRRPPAPFVAEFLGGVNRLPARALPGGGLEVPGLGPLSGAAAPPGATTAIVCVRPGDVALGPPAASSGVATGAVESALYLGEVVEYRVRVGDLVLVARVPAEGGMLAAGDRVGVRIDGARALVFPDDGRAPR